MKKTIDMCNAPLLSSMIKYCIPIILCSLLQQFFSAIDEIFAGQLTSSGGDAVAAVGATSSLRALLINFFIGCSTGGAVTLTHALGAKDKDYTEKTVHTAILLSIVLGAVLTVLGVTLSHKLLLYMSTPDYILSLSTLYLRVYFLSMIPYMVYNFTASLMRAMGETDVPLKILIVSGIIKIIFSFLFVSVLKLDIVGISLATVVSQTLSAFLGIIYMAKRNDECKFTFKKLKFSAFPLKKTLKLGIPSGLQSATFSLSNVLIQAQINMLSGISGFITGNAAAMSIQNFSDGLTGGFYQATMNFTGQNYGAEKYKRVKQIYFVSLAISTAFTLVVSVSVCLFSKTLLGIYNITDTDAIYWGKQRLLFMFIPLIFQGFMDITSGALRGMGVSFSSMLVSLVGICGLRTLWSYTVFEIPKYHFPETLFVVYPLSWIVTFIALAVLFIRVYKKSCRTD